MLNFLFGRKKTAPAPVSTESSPAATVTQTARAVSVPQTPGKRHSRNPRKTAHNGLTRKSVMRARLFGRQARHAQPA